MKTRNVLVMLSLLAAMILCGCCEEQRIAPAPAIDKTEVNQAAVKQYSETAMRNAVITQHTLYPYHFVNNSSRLNVLGERDLGILTEHFQDNPGRLIVMQGDESDLLYQSRGQLVYERLLAAGIPQDKIDITEGMPGGDGMVSASVIEVLEQAKEKPEVSESYGGSQMQF